MDFDWGNYIKVSDSLLDQVDSAPTDGVKEGLKRSSVSRAYYGVFHSALIYAKNNTKNPFIPPNEDKAKIHYLLINHFKDHIHDEVGRKLDRFRIIRNQCDYDDGEFDIDQLVITSKKCTDYILKITNPSFTR